MKFIWTSLLTAVAVATSAYADCSSLPGATESLSGSFQISAFNASTETTTALHLINFLTVPMTAFHVLSTSSNPSFGWLGFTLSGGIVKATPPNENLSPAVSIGAAFVDPNIGFPTSGPFPMWSNDGINSPPWCAVPQTDGNAILALDGYANLFSLCTSFMSQTVPVTTAVVFNASASAVGDGDETYNGASCTPVTLLLVPQ